MEDKKTKYSENQIKQALTYIEIFDKSDEIDCKDCGYDTCREFAVAMLDGKAKPSKCTVFSKKIIDKFKKKEKELRENLFLSQEILDAVPAPVLYEDLTGRAIGCNRAYEELAGVKRFEIKGRKLSEYSNNPDYDKLNEQLNDSILKSKNKQVVETTVKNNLGEQVIIELSKDIFTDRAGDPAGFVSIIFDITDRVNLVRELAVAKDTAELSVSLLKKMPTGFVIIDENLKIIDSNRAFASLMGEDILSVDEVNPGLKGADIKSIMDSHQLFSSLIQSGEESYSKDVEQDGKKLRINIFTIEKKKTAGALILDLSLPDIKTGEVKRRAEEVIKENLATVQKIAYLLGENASKTENVLSSVIKLLSDDEK
ncbi:MAG: PAS domain S-box protein [Candidatus Delongbacteria bacterium]|nr:PAS domain S-box protein [Candidatus Delongbacteria bacterium]